MQVRYLTTKQDYKKFIDFKAMLYKGDKNYVDTATFALEDVLFQKTAFTKSCKVFPVAVEQDGKFLVQAIFIYNAKLPILQVGFFEAVKNAESAVNALIGEAMQKAKQLGVKQIVIGLNAHISYGVGILSSGFDFKNSFDSLYNKSYYKNYFAHLKKQTLSTYRLENFTAQANFKGLSDKKAYRIEYADLKDFKASTERMRRLCDKTIGKTFLYYPTEELHFYELMKDLQPFLSNKNLFFAVDQNGNDAGFIFWHPDFNQMLNGGEKTSALKILFGYLFNRKRIDTAKLNAIGSVSQRATLALVNELYKQMTKEFKYIETNFVWDNNLNSTAINRRFFGSPHRKYEVYFIDENG